MLASEDDRHTQFQTGHHRRGNARGFDGNDLGHAGVGEQASELVTDQLHQRGIDLVVEKRVDFENLIGKHDAFFANLLMQCFHCDFLDVDSGLCGRSVSSNRPYKPPWPLKAAKLKSNG